MEEDDFWYEPEPQIISGQVVLEDDPLEPEFTGLFDAQGNAIMRVPMPKPKPGFISFDPDNAELFDYDPVGDYMYQGIPFKQQEQ